MKKASLLIAIVFSVAAFNYTHAQLRKVPAEVTNAFKAKYPDTKNVEWKDKITGFNVNYVAGGNKCESKFSNKGEWEQTEKTITKKALPSSVLDGYNKSKYTKWPLKTVTMVDSKESGVQYRLYIRKNGVEKKYLYFDKNGKLLRDAITI